MAAKTMDGGSESPDFAWVYADFSSRLQFSDLELSTVAAAKLNLFDTLACSVAGLAASGVPELLEIVDD